jgi:pyrroline-5-carboxylate reductase
VSLKDKTIAIIGTGAMGSAACRGLLKAKAVESQQIVATDIHREKVDALVHELGIRSAPSNVEAARQADIVMLCVKPYLIHDVVEEIAGVIIPQKLIISIAAGVPISRIEDLLPPRTPVIRAMPNTCAIVGAGAAAYARGRYASEEHAAAAHEIFTSFGSSGGGGTPVERRHRHQWQWSRLCLPDD